MTLTKNNPKVVLIIIKNIKLLIKK